MESPAAPEVAIDEQCIDGAATPEAGGDAQDALPPDAGLRAKLDRLLARLDRLWKSNAKHELHDLKTRHMTGTLLNELLGPPTKRLPHGEATLSLVGQRCQVSESELSRMRWFAHLVPDFDDLQITLDRLKTESILSEAPTVRSWTQLKSLLPALKVLKSGKKCKPAARRTRPVWGRVLKHLDSVTSELAQADSSPEGESKEQLLAKLREFSELMSSRFQITLSVD